MRPELSPSGTSPSAMSSQAQHSSILLSDKQGVFTTSHFPFPAPSVMFTSPQAKGAAVTVQERCFPSRWRRFGTPPVEVWCQARGHGWPCVPWARLTTLGTMSGGCGCAGIWPSSGMVTKTAASGVSLCEFESRHHPLLALGPWASYVTCELGLFKM